MTRIIMVARWAGSRESDFYPWLRAEASVRCDTWDDVELLPDPAAARIEPSVQRLCEQVLESPEPAICIAHSAACQVVMRALSRVPKGRIASALLVAPWFDLDEPWEAIRPWTTESFDSAAALAAGVPIRALLSDNDPFTADHVSTGQQLKHRVGASVLKVPGAGHFNRSAEPEVLSELLAMLS